MGKLKVDAAGGFPAIFYVFKKGFEAGGLWKLWQRLTSKNTCKTCALGMGGQKGGMVNEAGHFPEVCKKSVQAQAGDMAGSIPESYFKATPIKQFEYHTPEELEKLGRITFPLLATPEDTHFRRISWEEAYAIMAPAFQQAPPTQTFFYSSGRASNEAAFLLQLMARAYGSPNIHNCSFYCHQASSVALQEIYGSGTASVNLEDLKHTQVAVVIGANPASNHPRLITQLIRLRRRGGKVIIINPIKELGLVRFRLPSDIPSLLFGSQISDLYLQPKIGSDIHLFKAILKGLIESNQLDTDFIQHHSTQWEEVAQDIQNTPWQVLIHEC
ncbi:MAG: molybdopterin-dependent oxidoreductase, partial [Cyanobacteria bacterium]|nr:molybdopterin-dependent oxidoreductase [Cyanobacteriota bacterium]